MDFSGNPNTGCAGKTPNTFEGTLVYASVDSTFIRMEANTQTRVWTAYFPDGTLVTGPIIAQSGNAIDSDADGITDRNGNTLTIVKDCPTSQPCTETLHDAQGRNIILSYASNSGQTVWTDTITWPGINQRLTTTVSWESYTPAGLVYYCRITPVPTTFVGATCLLSSSPAASVVNTVQLPASNTNSINFLFGYSGCAASP